MRAIDFASAYDSWLRRSAPSVTEPVEPVASEYGVPDDLAEPLRAHIRLAWESEVIERAKARASQKTI